MSLAVSRMEENVKLKRLLYFPDEVIVTILTRNEALVFPQNSALDCSHFAFR